MARSNAPLALALVAALLGGGLVWLVVGADAPARSSAGSTVGPEVGFVALGALLAGGVAFLVSRRWIAGPKLVQDDWALAFPGAPAATLGELAERLAGFGYQLTWSDIDEAGADKGSASLDQPIIAAHVRVRERRSRARKADVILRLTPPTAERAGYGFVESHEVPDGLHRELAQYLIAVLAPLLPGLTYLRLASATSPDPAAELLGQLPRRPRRLVA